MNQELVGQSSQVRQHLDQVEAVFPSSLQVKAHRALVYYHARGTVSVAKHPNRRI